MKKIKDPVVAIPLDNGVDWFLTKDITYYSTVLSTSITVKNHFVFDFASVPRFFWRIFPPATGKHRYAAVVHDWLCDTQFYSRALTDKVFYEIMISSGVSKVSAKILYWSVRLGGWYYWENKPIEKIMKTRALMANPRETASCDVNWEKHKEELIWQKQRLSL